MLPAVSSVIRPLPLADVPDIRSIVRVNSTDVRTTIQIATLGNAEVFWPGQMMNCVAYSLDCSTYEARDQRTRIAGQEMTFLQGATRATLLLYVATAVCIPDSIGPAADRTFNHLTFILHHCAFYFSLSFTSYPLHP